MGNQELLATVTEKSLACLPGVREVYTKAEGDLVVISEQGLDMRLTNRGFGEVDELLGHKVSESLERRLASDSDEQIVVAELGGGYASTAASELLTKYQDERLRVMNIDLFASHPSTNDSRLTVVRSDFTEAGKQGTKIDVVYSWQLFEHLGRVDNQQRIAKYNQIVGWLANGGEAIIDDPGTAEYIELGDMFRDGFKEKLGVSEVKTPFGTWEGRDFRRFVYLKK